MNGPYRYAVAGSEAREVRLRLDKPEPKTDNRRGDRTEAAVHPPMNP